LEVAGVAAPERVAGGFDVLGAAACGLRHDPVDFFLAVDVVADGEVRRARRLERTRCVLGDAASRPEGEPQAVCRSKNATAAVLGFRADDVSGRQSIAIERERPSKSLTPKVMSVIRGFMADGKTSGPICPTIEK